jgi:hypothetical protein
MVKCICARSLQDVIILCRWQQKYEMGKANGQHLSNRLANSPTFWLLLSHKAVRTNTAQNLAPDQNQSTEYNPRAKHSCCIRITTNWRLEFHIRLSLVLLHEKLYVEYDKDTTL